MNGMFARLRSWWRDVRRGSAVNRDKHREQGRSSRGLLLFDEVRGDTTYGLRMLLRNPGFSLVAVLTLGLGIGVTAAIFSALDAVLLRPLPFVQPERLVEVSGVDLPVRFGSVEPPKSTPQIDDAQALPAFSHVSAYAPGALNLSGSGPPRRVSIGAVTTDFFTTLGVHPVVGRGFSADEGVPGQAQVAIVSHGFWRRHLGSATDLQSHAVTLNGRQYPVVGVMPAGFEFPVESEIWIPLTLPVSSFEPFRQYLPSRMIARLAPGASLDQAQSQVDALHVAFAAEGRQREPTALAEQVKPLHGSLVGERRTMLLVLLGATALVLLVACANVANLLLSRSSARQREIAVRAAMGATPGRVARQMMVESLLLAVIGGAIGMSMAAAGVQLLDVLVPPALRGAAPLRVDARMLGFALTTTLLTGLAFGLLPSLGARRADAGAVLKHGSGGAAGAGSPRTRQALVLAETALAVMLLVGSALMLRSMHVLLTTESGVDPERVATLELTLAAPDYPDAEARRQFYTAVLERLNARPEVEAAAAINELPLRGQSGIRFTVYAEGRPPESMDVKYMAQDLRITPDYFQAMGIHVLQGRAPRHQTDSTAMKEVAINRALADLYWPGESPIGQRLEMPGEIKLEIVGVVANVLPSSLASEPIPQAYYSLLDTPYSNAAIVVRGRVPARTLTGWLEEAVRAAAPNQAVYNVRTMEQVISSAIAARRTNTWLIASFGALALVLASIGVYGVIAFNVARRTREIGIRMALGARRGAVRWAVVREAGTLALAGIALGMIGAWMLSRVLGGMIFGITERDPLAFTVAPLVLLAAALLAALVPAQRATRVDPVTAIRSE